VSLTWSKEQKPEDVIIPWFAKKGNAAGFSVDECHLVTLGWTMGYRPKDEKALRFRAALLEGTLRVADPDAFLRALTAGIGPAKAFGFGLLSVAPA
jgi:CRISPR system Cascade subunit CasE